MEDFYLRCRVCRAPPAPFSCKALRIVSPLESVLILATSFMSICLLKFMKLGCTTCMLLLAFLPVNYSFKSSFVPLSFSLGLFYSLATASCVAPLLEKKLVIIEKNPPLSFYFSSFFSSSYPSFLSSRVILTVGLDTGIRFEGL